MDLKYFYPRPPRGGRLARDKDGKPVGLFLSTPSARRATCHAWSHGVAIGISIHALREEGDPYNRRKLPHQTDFYPRPPRGGRRGLHGVAQGSDAISIHALREEGDMWTSAAGYMRLRFLSTPSARRATYCGQPLREIGRISIHALREEGDQAGGRPISGADISIHALREEGDHQAGTAHHQREQFLSTPSARRATHIATT